MPSWFVVPPREYSGSDWQWCYALGGCVLFAETAKATQASLERKIARLKDEQEAQSKALTEVSQCPAVYSALQSVCHLRISHAINTNCLGVQEYGPTLLSSDCKQPTSMCKV